MVRYTNTYSNNCYHILPAAKAIINTRRVSRQPRDMHAYVCTKIGE
jgi:hypothetical protein